MHVVAEAFLDVLRTDEGRELLAPGTRPQPDEEPAAKDWPAIDLDRS